jgi:hypothetical protein
MTPAIQYAPYVPPAGITLVTLAENIIQSGAAPAEVDLHAPAAGKAMFYHSLHGYMIGQNNSAALAVIGLVLKDNGAAAKQYAQIGIAIPATTTVAVPFSLVLDLQLPTNHKLTATALYPAADVLTNTEIFSVYAEV